MKERPIPFSGEMVRAILDGAKTETRRVVKPRPVLWVDAKTKKEVGFTWKPNFANGATWPREKFIEKCPYGQPGDRLWVKETHSLREDVNWRTNPEKARHYARYRAGSDFDPKDELNWHQWGPWRSARFMPKCIARIWLEVTAVRIEQVQDISGEDAKAEGCASALAGDAAARRSSYRSNFAALWDSINEKHGFGWEVNPWVWVVKFRRILP